MFTVKKMIDASDVVKLVSGYKAILKVGANVEALKAYKESANYDEDEYNARLTIANKYKEDNKAVLEAYKAFSDSASNEDKYIILLASGMIPADMLSNGDFNAVLSKVKESVFTGATNKDVKDAIRLLETRLDAFLPSYNPRPVNSIDIAGKDIPAGVKHTVVDIFKSFIFSGLKLTKTGDVKVKLVSNKQFHSIIALYLYKSVLQGFVEQNAE